MAMVPYRPRPSYKGSSGFGPLAVAAAAKYGPPVAKYLFSKVAGKGRVTPAKAIANTKLKKYLDRTYEKKCGVEVNMRYATGTPAITTTLATLESPFVNIAQGLTDAGRIGSQVEVKSYKITAQFHAGTISTAPTLVRIIVCKQGQMQGVALTGAAVLLDPTNIRSPYLEDKQRSFTVLKDFTFMLSGFNSGNKDTYKRWVWTYRPKHCHAIEWDTADTTGAIGAMLKGNLQLLIMYEQPTGVASGPTCRTYSTAEWVDP